MQLKSYMYSLDVRKIAIRLYEQQSYRKVAIILKVAASTVCRWVHQCGKPMIRKRRASKLFGAAVIDALHLCISSDPFASIKTIRKTLENTFKVTVSNELVRQVIIKSGFSKKRARYFSVPKDDAMKLQTFIEKRAIYVAEKRIFVSIGYAKRGQRLFIQRKTPSVPNRSVISAVCRGAPISFTEHKGSINTERFEEFIKSLSYPERTVVLMDNVSFHHSHKVQQAIKQKGWDCLFVPPYSPVFNPIEGGNI